jgi:peptidyl-prolyl cis-trans isomerase SurA
VKGKAAIPAASPDTWEIPSIMLSTRSLTSRIALVAALAGTLVSPLAAQTVANEGGAPEVGLDIPANAVLFGDPNSNVYRPTATVNGEIITATDVEQRIALVRIANQGAIPDGELGRLRLQIFSRLIDEVLQIQEARANDIEVTQAEVDAQYARIAASFRQTPQQFTQFLTANGSSERAMKQQIRGELSWQNLLGRNIEPFTQVSEDEVRTLVSGLQAARGTPEYRYGEIYLPATPDTIAAVAENARRLMAQLSEGAPFQELARQFSQSSTAAAGGDGGWVRASQLPESMSAALQRMQAGQLAGPIETPGGLSILLLIDQRQVLTADPRDASLSLKQITLPFAPGTTQAQATELASRFATATQAINGCGPADAVAASLGANVISRDQIAMRDLPPQLQATLGAMQVGQVTPPFGSPTEGISVLILCGRDMPAEAAMPSVEDITERMREERVNRRAQRYLRDLRRDAVIEYS